MHFAREEILSLKIDIKRKQKEIVDLQTEVEQYVMSDKKIED